MSNESVNNFFKLLYLKESLKMTWFTKLNQLVWMIHLNKAAHNISLCIVIIITSVSICCKAVNSRVWYTTENEVISKFPTFQIIIKVFSPLDWQSAGWCRGEAGTNVLVSAAVWRTKQRYRGWAEEEGEERGGPVLSPTCHVWIRPAKHVEESAWGITPGGKDN